MAIYLCPTDKKYHCSWEGHPEDILHHFEKEHDDLLHYNDTFNIDIAIPSENRLFFIGGEIYLTQILTNNQNLIFKLRYLGPEKLARKITYNLSFRISNYVCQSEYLKTTPQGFFEIDLAGLKNTYADLENLTCSLNITKEFVDDDSVESVFFEDTSTVTDKIEQVSYTDSILQQDIGIIRENETVPETVQQEVVDEVEQKQPENVEKIDETNDMVIEKDSNELNVIQNTDTIDVKEEAMPEIGVMFRNSVRHTSDPPEVSPLQRSKSTAFEDMRRSWYRAKSTLSLCSIQEMDSAVICTNCGDILKIPVYICPTGHHFCESCQPGTCHLCELKITFVRDAELEKIINKFSLSSCQYHKYGCPEKLLHTDLHQHEVNCAFCTYNCPMGECFFEGQYKGLVKHLKLIHSSTKLLSSFILAFNNYAEAFLANEEKGIFYCYATYSSQDVTWVAKFCGPKGRNFFCELKFKDGKVKEPVLLKKKDGVYSVTKSLNELKRMKLKAKNAVLTITF